MTNFEDHLDETEVKNHHYTVSQSPTEVSMEELEYTRSNLLGQTLLVAMKSSSPSFSPHSVHSYFTKNVRQDKQLEWEVEEISNGNNFCCRCVRGIQDHEIKFIATISLTKNNFLRTSEKIHDQHKKGEQFKSERTRICEEPANEYDFSEQDYVDDGEVPKKPFHFSTPYPRILSDISIDELHHYASSRFVFMKIPPESNNLEIRDLKFEELCPSTDRRIAWFVRLGLGNIKIGNPIFQFAALAALSNSISSTALSRHLRSIDFRPNDAYFDPVSTDHTIFFHDVDFDATEWMGFAFKVLRLSSGRFLFEAQMYNSARQHVATIYQEGFACFDRVEMEAML